MSILLGSHQSGEISGDAWVLQGIWYWGGHTEYFSTKSLIWVHGTQGERQRQRKQEWVGGGSTKPHILTEQNLRGPVIQEFSVF